MTGLGTPRPAVIAGLRRQRLRAWLLCTLLAVGSTGLADTLSFHTRSTLPGGAAGAASASVAATLVLPGKLYEPPIVLEPGAPPYPDATSPLFTSQALWEAFIADEDAEILAHWARGDRRLIRAVLADTEVRDLNRRLLGAHQQKRVFGVAELNLDRPYRLLLVRHDADPQALGQVEAYVYEDQRWKATHALVENDRFDTVWQAFRAGEIVPVESTDP